jgi:hypothetical protein
MAFLGVLTFGAGIASWRRNSRHGLHQHDRGMPPAETVDEVLAPGIPDMAHPDARPAPPHRRRRRRRPASDGD